MGEIIRPVEGQLKKTIVINMFGASGAGKSSGAFYITGILKMLGINCDMASEAAKDHVWENNVTPFNPENQISLFGEQYYRLSRLRDKVDVIVTDCPLPLSILYNTSALFGKEFEKVVIDCFNSFTNVNYFIQRAKKFFPVGRFETAEQSDQKARELKDILQKYEIPTKTYLGTLGAYNLIILDFIQKYFPERLEDFNDMGLM